MLPIRRIVFPVDFSARCAGAAHFVEALAKRFNAEIAMLHIVEPADYLYGTPELGAMGLRDFHSQRMAQSRRMLDGFLAEELKPFKVERQLLEGDPAKKIVEVAHNWCADLVMMPSHGFGPFRRFILGSVTAKVLHDAECPVWTGVHMEEAPPLEQIEWNRVVCAVDLGPNSERTLSWAAHLVRESMAELTVVHATPAVEARPAKYLDSEVFAEMQKQARAEIQKILEHIGLRAEICLEGGDPAAVVRHATLSHNADLLVIGRGSAAGGLGRLRTHAYSIIRQSSCQVLSV